MARALQNRLTHLLSSRRSSSPRCSSQVSQLHASRISQRFWNLLNLEYSQRNNGAKCDTASKPNCSTSNPRIVTLKSGRCIISKPSVGELLSKWCCQFNDKFHHDQAPQLPYYRQRAPQLPRRPCSKAPFCPTAPCPPPPCPPKPCDPCPKTEPCPAEPPSPCQNQESTQCKKFTSASQSSRDPCKKRKPCDPCRPRTCPPRPYPPKPCEQCPRTPSCPKPKPCPPPPCPKPLCPDPCDPCRPKPTPMGCPSSTPMDCPVSTPMDCPAVSTPMNYCPMPTRCSRAELEPTINLNSTNGILPMAMKVDRSVVNRPRSQMRGFHGSTMRNLRCNDHSSVKKRPNKRVGKKGKKSKTRARKAVCSDSMPIGKIFAKPSRSKRSNYQSKKDHKSGKPDQTQK